MVHEEQRPWKVSREVVITYGRPCAALLALFSVLVQNVVFEPVVSASPGRFVRNTDSQTY